MNKNLKDRADAIERLESIVIRDALQEDYDALDMAIQALEQEQKTGHWIDKEHRKEEYVLIGKCSVCGRVRVLDEFCSNCGARMESEVKNETI